MGSATVVATLTLIGASTAQAAGICFDPRIPTGAPAVAVVKKYSRPSPGTCKPFAGWASWYPGRPVVGTACLNSAADTLRAAYTVHTPVPIFVTIEFPYPALTGGTSETQVEGESLWSTSFDAAAGTCFDLFYPMP